MPFVGGMASVYDVGLTPAQHYRKAMTDLTGVERELVQLEQRWKKKINKWSSAAVVVQSLARGYFARTRVAVIREKVRIEKKQKDHAEKALWHLRFKRYDEALREAAEALEMGENFGSRRVRGHTFLSLKKFQDAVIEYDLALTIEPDDIEVRLGRTRCFTHLQDYQHAKDDLAHLMDLPGKSDPQWYFMRGLIHGKLKQWQEAVNDFGRVVTLKGKGLPPDLIRKGFAEAAAQRFEAAAATFSESLRIQEKLKIEDDNTVKALYLRGRTYCCLRDWGAAEDDFHSALKIEPTCKEAKRGIEVVNIPHLPLPLTD